MPTQYTRGTANAQGYYQGATIANETALLTTIRDEQILAGQTVHLDDISGSKKLIMRGSDNGHNCYIVYETETVNGNDKKLKITGDDDGTETLQGVTVELDFLEDGEAKLYMTSDEGAGCIMIHNPASFSQSAHFGFLERRDITNPHLIMTGYLNVWLTGACIRKSTVGGEDWKEFHTFFNNAAENQDNPIGDYAFLWDWLTCPVTRSNLGQTTSQAYAYKPWLGGLDPVSSKPLLGMYGYREGVTNYQSYTINDLDKARTGYFPGPVKFARSGLCLLDPAVQSPDGSKMFISGGDQEFQGFQIAG